MNIQICDCTLRDGGYYTNWDFNKELVESYFKTVNQIEAITYIEIGYRSLPMNEYLGEYYYCPIHVLNLAKQLCPTKKIAVMLNEKDTPIKSVSELLACCKDIVSLIRIAVNPKEIQRAIDLAIEVKKKGFDVAFNIMYMSHWAKDSEFISHLNKLNGIVDYVYMVDSFGGVYPADVKNLLETLKKTINIPIGFHGHNNLELALANTISAIDSGCNIVDSTITGMGRGAGNLKTELLLTYLSSKKIINFNFNVLNLIVSDFEKLQKEFQWGTNLAYMISGANSLPQKDVMSWISKRRFSTESIINALQNKKDQLNDNFSVNVLENQEKSNITIIIGGGLNTLKHAHALLIYCKNNPDVVLIHAGTRYVKLFNNLMNRQYYCLVGSEGNKLQKDITSLNLDHIKCVLEPSPRLMGTILPSEVVSKTYELSSISFMNNFPDSLLTISFQLSIDLKTNETFLFGMDGYDIKSEELMIEVSKENQDIINAFISSGEKLTSLLPTFYQNVITKSIYSLI